MACSTSWLNPSGCTNEADQCLGLCDGMTTTELHALGEPDASCDGMFLLTTGLATDADGGGGNWVWDNAADKSTANLGTVIDPSVGLTLALQGTGTGTGCWVRDYSGVMDVKLFGAAGDGVTDDTSAVQATIDAAAVAAEQAFISAGEYLISSALTFTDGASITGVPRRTYIVYSTDIIGMQTAAGGAANWTVTDLIIAPKANTTKAGFFIDETSTRWILSRVEVDNMRGGQAYNGIHIKGSFIGSLNDCIAQDCLNDGFWLEGTAGTNINAVTLNNCISEGNESTHLHIDGAQNVNVLGGVYEGSLAPWIFNFVDCNALTVDTYTEQEYAGENVMQCTNVKGSQFMGYFEGGSKLNFTNSSYNNIGPLGSDPVTVTLDATSDNNQVAGALDTTYFVDNGSNNVIFSGLSPALFTKRTRVDALAFDAANREFLDTVYDAGAFMLEVNASGTGTQRKLRLGTAGATDIQLAVDGTVEWTVQGTTGALYGNDNYMWLKERSDPAAPTADGAFLYVKDNGSGKTQLVVRFPTGAVQVIATEP